MVKALHQHLRQEAWDPVVARLLGELPLDVPNELIEKARFLDAFYMSPRYPNMHAEGPPLEHFGPLQSEQAIGYADEILDSSVLTWPDAATVHRATRAWARKAAAERPELVRIGYIGSYARAIGGSAATSTSWSSFATRRFPAGSVRPSSTRPGCPSRPIGGSSPRPSGGPAAGDRAPSSGPSRRRRSGSTTAASSGRGSRAGDDSGGRATWSWG